MFAEHHTDATNLSTTFPGDTKISQIEFSSDILQGFIQHPQRFPLHFRKRRFCKQINKPAQKQLSNIGLSFISKTYQKPGSILDITIPTSRETHCFPAKVVAVQAQEQGFRIGVLSLDEADSPRLRIIEQICHIELYLNDKKYRDDPFVSKEKITEE